MATRDLEVPARAASTRAGPITYEQFLEWLDEGTFAEWVNGS